ncbi:hypothetical protein [Thalassospira alkalitolerans]|uniref:hypothetical protein n=1 Tax=Thalassospira alkalitolerans TaxID=1293890 RepID=UPI003AA90A0E
MNEITTLHKYSDADVMDQMTGPGNRAGGGHVVYDVIRLVVFTAVLLFQSFLCTWHCCVLFAKTLSGNMMIVNVKDNCAQMRKTG